MVDFKREVREVFNDLDEREVAIGRTRTISFLPGKYIGTVSERVQLPQRVPVAAVFAVESA